jgi:hypothetical protein
LKAKRDQKDSIAIMAESPLKPITFIRQVSSTLIGSSRNVNRSADSLRSLDAADDSSVSASDPMQRGSMRRGHSISKKSLRASNEKERMQNNARLDADIYLEAVNEGEEDSPRQAKDGKDNKLSSKAATYRSVRFSYDHLEAEGAGVTADGTFNEINEGRSTLASIRNLSKEHDLHESGGIISDDAVDIETSEESVLFPYMTLPMIKQLPTNLTMADFTDIEEIGNGANANVSKAKYQDKIVVIKMIKCELASSPKVQKEFDTEFEILARLNHPHIIRVYGMGTSPRKFIVLEYLSAILGAVLSNNMINPSFEKLCHRYNYPYDVMLQYARQLADALDYLHSRANPKISIIHRGK